MSKIRITSVPTGEAPKHVRQAWVGVEIPLHANQDFRCFERGVLGGKADSANVGGYRVSPKAAIAALTAAGKTDAAEWWRRWAQENAYLLKSMDGCLTFGKKFCELIED